MAIARNWMAALLGLALVPQGDVARAQASDAQQGLLVVYGKSAASREGDTDRREQIYFSVPADLKDRIYVRIFDPETVGNNDFTKGGSWDAITTYRLFGGDGAFSAADRPEPVADGAREPRLAEVEPVTGPGKLIKESAWDSDPKTDGRWVNLTALRARQGEVIGDRAYFRIDVQGSAGNDGNGFSVGVSLSRDRARPPEGLEMFAYRPTVRWAAQNPPTQVRFANPNPNAPMSVQSFDGANGELALVTDFDDIKLRISGQDFWTSDTVQTGDTNLALSLLGGFETPNDVTLAVFDENGAAVPLAMPPTRSPQPSRPYVAGTARPLADCRAVAFDASMSRGRIPLGVSWDFGDGSTSEDPVIAHRYAAPGQYTARLEVVESGTRPGRGAAVEMPVHVRNAPVAVPGAAIVVAPGQPVSFDGTKSQPSDSPISRYRWSFGDGTLAEGPITQHVYANPGQFRAVLRVEDDSQHPCNFGVETRNVVVNFPPVAEAGTDQTAVVGQPVTFGGAASYDIDGVIETYSWNMGDGTVLTGPTVTHTFQNSGNYPVALTVTDDSGVANNIAIDRMFVGVNNPPKPSFEIPPRPLSVSEAGLFDASASVDEDGQILSYMWNFGDGATGEGQVVNYAWTQPGTFTVTLTVTDDSGTGSAVQSTTKLVRVDAAPVADAGADQYVTASVVSFDGGGSLDPDGTVTEWVWDFGDGGTATGQTPSHAYLRSGVYEVAVTVRDDSTAPLNTDRDTMLVTVNATPIADAGPPQTVAPGEEFIVSGRASIDPDGEISQYVWTFPDGTEATGQRASHMLTDPGLHRIGLTVYDNFPGGAAQDQSEVLITVNAPPVAVAGPDHLIAPGDSVVFDASQSYDTDGQMSAFRWEFDDLGAPLDAPRIERAYTAPGVWSAQLVVTDDSGVLNATASDDVTIRVNAAPVAEAGPAITTDSLYVEFDASGSADADGDALIYRWDFGDGSVPAYGEKTTHVFPRSGIFPVTLRVDDGTGLSNARAIDATTVTIQTRPMADAGGNRDVCSGEPILFDASASVDPDGGLLLYSWDFGDGSGSDLINPTKTYEQPGVYPVTLRVRNETGTEHGTDLDRIAALVREGPIADAGPDMTVCSNQQIRFDGSGSTDADGAVNAFDWTFGDGSTGNGENPVHVFTRPGTYNVTLTITGEARGACSPLDDDIAKVTVIAAPELVMVGPERVGSGIATLYTAEVQDSQGGTIENVTWDFGDGTTLAGAEVEHSFAEPGEYLVTLRASILGGHDSCSELESVRKVIVNDAPQPVIDGPEAVAVGDLVTFDASQSTDSDGAVIAYTWDFGDGSSGRGVSATHRYEDPGTYTLRLTALDDAGVGNSQVQVEQTILVNPAPVAGLQAPKAICPAQNVPWAVAVGENTQVDWQFGDGSHMSGANVSHAFDRAGLYPVLVAMDDGAGLLSSQRSEEVYVRVNRAPTALAGPDRIVCPGDQVTFNAGASGDLDGELSQWIWEFSDGQILEGPIVTRSFDTAADLRVRLTVRDDSGAEGCDTGTDAARILVNATPKVDAGPDLTVPVGAAHDVVRFDGSNASDPDGQGLRLSWDFGDGTGSTGAVTTHRFNQPGDFTVTVQARDTTGLVCGVGTDTAVITAVPRD